MSACPSRIEALLEADVDVLMGRGDTPLARHIRTCAGCAAAARTILRSNTELDVTLARHPPLDAATLVARARALEEARRDAPGTVPTSSWREQVRSRPTRRAALAVAASLTALLVWADRKPALHGTAWESSPELAPLVDAPRERDFAVLETGNPDITVIWFF